MAEYHLIPHPDFPSVAVTAITVTLERPFANAVSLAFRASGDLVNVLIPDEVAPGFEDGLWRHSCFEAFLGVEGSLPYKELNFAPSGRYAAYAFDDHRSGMRPDKDASVHYASSFQSGQSLELTWSVQLPDLAIHDAWRIGLSAIIEARDCTKSYWALAHAPGPPDFHNPDCFIATLPAPDAA